MNGLLNLAFPLFNAVDALFAFLPAFVRVALWGGIAGAVAMGLYWLLSDQGRIKERQDHLKAIRAEIKVHQDDFQKVMALSRQNLKASFGLLGVVLGPGLLSGLPVILIIAWISSYYSYAEPAPNAPVALAVEPANAGLAVEPPTARAGDPLALAWPPAPGTTRLVDASGTVFEALPLDPPVAVVHKPAWWNWLWGNPAGYLAENGATESVSFALERLRILGGVPGWMATWEFTFFAFTILASILIKVGFRIA